MLLGLPNLFNISNHHFLLSDPSEKKPIQNKTPCNNVDKVLTEQLDQASLRLKIFSVNEKKTLKTRLENLCKTAGPGAEDKIAKYQ